MADDEGTGTIVYRRGTYERLLGGKDKDLDRSNKDFLMNYINSVMDLVHITDGDGLISIKAYPMLKDADPEDYIIRFKQPYKIEPFIPYRIRRIDGEYQLWEIATPILVGSEVFLREAQHVEKAGDD